METASVTRALFAVVTFIAMTGCAGLKSASTDQDYVSGLAYYMPKRAFVLTVTMEVGAVKDLKWDVSAALPDLTKTYSLSYHPHWIGKTTIDVAVGPSGLLGVANTATTDSATELKKIVQAAAATKAKSVTKADPCPANGVFVFYFPEMSQDKVCNGLVEYRIEAMSLDKNDNKPVAGHKDSPRNIDRGESRQGVFYRQNRPYIATAWSASGSALATSLLSAPNDSPTMFLPFGRTLFAANDGKVTLDDGVLSTYKQADDGELVALLQFPATILGAYFSAVGNIFSAFSNRETNEANLKVKELKLGILRDQLAKCTVALEANDKDALETLDCANLAAMP